MLKPTREDPYLYARLAENIVQGAQGDDVSAPDKVGGRSYRLSHPERTCKRLRTRSH